MNIEITNEDRAILLADKITNYILETVEGISTVSVIINDKKAWPAFLEKRLSIYPLFITGGIGNRDLKIDFRSIVPSKMSEETFTLNIDGKKVYKTTRQLKEDFLQMFPEIKEENIYEKELYFNEVTVKEAVLAPNAKIAAKELDSDLNNQKNTHKSMKI